MPGPTLAVMRTSPRDIKIRDLYIGVDGTEIGNVPYGETLEIPVTQGEHSLTATNRLFTKHATFTCEGDQRVEFEVANVASGCGGLLFVVVGMGPYKVDLKRV